MLYVAVLNGDVQFNASAVSREVRASQASPARGVYFHFYCTYLSQAERRYAMFTVCLSQLSVCLTVRLSVKKKKFSHRHLRHYIGPLRGSTFSTLSRWGLNPIKPVYDPDQPDDRLNLIASAFNQLGQYTNSPGRRGYCYAELAVFFPSGGRNHRQYSLRLPTEGWPGMLSWPGWLVT